MSNLYAMSTNSTVELTISNVISTTGTENIDMLRVVFEYFFTTDASLKDQNKFLLLFLQNNIRSNNIDLIGRILSENALNELHPSLVKSLLIMTENLPEVEVKRQKVEVIFKRQMEAA